MVFLSTVHDSCMYMDSFCCYKNANFYLCLLIQIQLFGLEYTDCSILNYFQFKFFVELRFLTPQISYNKDFMNNMSHN